MSNFSTLRDIMLNIRTKKNHDISNKKNFQLSY